MATKLYTKSFTVVRTTSGRIDNLYGGVPVPDDIDPDDAKRLLEEEYLEEREVKDGEDGGEAKPAKKAAPKRSE